MEARRVLAAMELDLAASREVGNNTRVSIPVNSVLYAINIDVNTKFCRFTFKKSLSRIIVSYSLIFKTYRLGAKVEVPLEIGLLKNRTLFRSELGHEPFYVNQEFSGLRGFIAIRQGFVQGNTLDVVIINKGFSCGITFKSVIISLYDGDAPTSGALTPHHETHEIEGSDIVGIDGGEYVQ